MLEGDDFDQNDNMDPEQIPRDPRYYNAMYFLSLETQHKIPKSSIDGIVSSTSTLLDQHLNSFKKELSRELQSRGIDSAFIEKIDVSAFLDDFKSDKHRQNYYKTDMPTYISPKEVVLGSKFHSKNGILQEIPRVGYIVPFEKNIQNLINMPEVWYCIKNPHFSRDEFMHDICDGDYVTHHALFSRNPQALQIILNCDDLETVNPLGSHVKNPQNISILFHFRQHNSRVPIETQ